MATYERRGRLSIVFAGVFAAIVSGCGEVPAGRLAPFFTVPITINGEPIGDAVIDTGGGFELMLRKPFGLRIIDEATVLAFGGQVVVDVTEGFAYTAAGTPATAAAALVGTPVCDCNGLGFLFFQQTGTVLALDFQMGTAAFLRSLPPADVIIPFSAPPDQLPDFDSAFIEIEVSMGNASIRTLGLLDTGAAVTIVRRGLVGVPGLFTPNQLEVVIGHEQLGTLGATVGLHETAGLPDVILGNDLMATWANRWYFDFAPGAGRVSVVFGGAQAIDTTSTQTE